MKPSDRIKFEFLRFLRNETAAATYHWERCRRGEPSLTAIMNYHGSDKGTLHGPSGGVRAGHGFALVYEELLAAHRHRPVKMLEIGIGPKQPGIGGAAGLFRQRRPGGSVTGWHEYFANGQIHAIDLADCRHLDRERLTTHVADQSSRQSLERLVEEIGSPIDIIIDDGSHASAHQQTTLSSLLPHLATDGVYVIENLDWQIPELDDGVTPKTMDLLRKFRETGQFETSALTPDQQRAIETQLCVVMIRDQARHPGGAFAVLASS